MAIYLERFKIKILLPDGDFRVRKIEISPSANDFTEKLRSIVTSVYNSHFQTEGKRLRIYYKVCFRLMNQFK